MAPDEEPGGRGNSVLAGLLAPLRLPERVIETLESLAKAARELGPMRAELTRVREHIEPLAGLMPAVERLLQQIEPMARTVEEIGRRAEPLGELLPALNGVKEELVGRLDSLQEVIVSLEGNESHLNLSVRELAEELVSLHKTVNGLQDDVERITNRLPDPEQRRGPLGAARDALTGSGD